MATEANLRKRIEQLVADGSLWYGMSEEAMARLYERCCRTWHARDGLTRQMREWGSGYNEDFNTFRRFANDALYGEGMDLAAHQMYDRETIRLALDIAARQTRSPNSPYYIPARILTAYLTRCRESDYPKDREELEWFLRFAGMEPKDYPYFWDPKDNYILQRFAALKHVDHPMSLQLARALEWADRVAHAAGKSQLYLNDEECQAVLNRTLPGQFRHVLAAKMVGGPNMSLNDAIQAAREMHKNSTLKGVVQSLFVFV